MSAVGISFSRSESDKGVPMRFWFDTEFIEDGKTIDLVSIGVLAEDGHTYYAEGNYILDLARRKP